VPGKHLISPGIGFSPGSVKYIVTRGLSIGAVVAVSPTTVIVRCWAHPQEKVRAFAHPAEQARAFAHDQEKVKAYIP